MHVDREFKFFFRRPGSGEHSKRLVKWSAQNIGSEDRRMSNDRI
jgi:hypothetical protein